jgi:hypothetical protein
MTVNFQALMIYRLYYFMTIDQEIFHAHFYRRLYQRIPF